MKIKIFNKPVQVCWTKIHWIQQDIVLSHKAAILNYQDLHNEMDIYKTGQNIFTKVCFGDDYDTIKALLENCTKIGAFWLRSIRGLDGEKP